jgi:hypothetical protein
MLQKKFSDFHRAGGGGSHFAFPGASPNVNSDGRWQMAYGKLPNNQNQ